MDVETAIRGINVDVDKIADPAARSIVSQLLNIIEYLFQENKELKEENQKLRDENSRLKGEQGKPNIRPQAKGSKDVSSESERKKVSSPNLRVVSNNRISLSSSVASPITFYRKTLTSKALNELARPIEHVLVKKMEQKGWIVIIAKEGSQDFKYLNSISAEASISSGHPKHIILKEGATKSCLLEEHLHGTQVKLGLLEKYGTYQELEVHVKDFMLRHVKMLGLDNPHDIKLLQQLKIEELNRLKVKSGI